MEIGQYDFINALVMEHLHEKKSEDLKEAKINLADFWWKRIGDRGNSKRS